MYFVTFGDIFENFIIDTASSPKLYRHHLLGHLQKIIGNVEDYPPMSGVRNDNIHHLQPLTSD